MSDHIDDLAATIAGGSGGFIQWLRTKDGKRACVVAVLSGMMCAYLANGIILWKWPAIPENVRYGMDGVAGLGSALIIEMLLAVVRRMTAVGKRLVDTKFDLPEAHGTPPNGFLDATGPAAGGRRDRTDSGPFGFREPAGLGEPRPAAAADGGADPVDVDPAVPRPFGVRVRGEREAGK